MPLHVPDDLPLVLTVTEAAVRGLGAATWRRSVAEGRWLRLARGVCCTRERWESADRVERHRLVAVAHHRRWPTSVVSHLSAAAMHGLPMPLAPRGQASLDDRPPSWLTLPPGRGVSPRRSGPLTVEVAALDAADVDRTGPSPWGAPIAVTTRARTVVDCLRTVTAHDAVAIADAAARRGTTRAAFQEALERQGGWPGVRRARDLLALVDPRRESWLESVSAVAFHALGLPPGEPQVEAWTPGGRLVARVDALWRDLGVVGEADGWAKYATGDASTNGVQRALRAEKQREDALRDLGLEVVRRDTRGVLDPVGRDETVQRFRRAAARGDPSRVRARLLATVLPQGWRPQR